MNPQGEVTRLLTAWGKGDQDALNELMPLVYDELHRMAQRAWRGLNQGNTLQPTALINEAYLKLAGAKNATFQNRCHFLAVACTAMRQILVNHARSRHAGKRGSGQLAVSLDDVQLAVHQEAAEVVALHEALERLHAIDARKSKVIEMRYFGGLSIEETAEALEVSVITVNRDWRLARAWLLREMNGGPS
ncbi:MAG TPA: sigma-70 family RNA polymerase sigma factor [Terracidiphilus sp.]|jgi:RNA polymerase sigma factor (TIGR02999 family)|nr:sigma-70 family RNA polymerase sigma factor [Terracidiphilus sp.]